MKKTITLIYTALLLVGIPFFLSAQTVTDLPITATFEGQSIISVLQEIESTNKKAIPQIITKLWKII